MSMRKLCRKTRFPLDIREDFKALGQFECKVIISQSRAIYSTEA
jgi:hypothetical protein